MFDQCVRDDCATVYSDWLVRSLHDNLRIVGNMRRTAKQEGAMSFISCFFDLFFFCLKYMALLAAIKII